MDYKQIGEDGAAPTPTDSSSSPADGDGSSPSVMQRGLKALCSGWESVKSHLPDVSNVYIDPINPKADITLSDRAHLIMRETRPWFAEFLNPRQLNLPPLSQVKTRVGHNITTFFYNYFILVLVQLVATTVMHPGPVFMLALYGAALYALFVWKKEDIEVGHNGITFVIDQNVKLFIAIVLFVLFVMFGNILFPVIYTAIVIAILVGVHGSLHDDEAVDDSDVVTVA